MNVEDKRVHITTDFASNMVFTSTCKTKTTVDEFGCSIDDLDHDDQDDWPSKRIIERPTADAAD